MKKKTKKNLFMWFTNDSDLLIKKDYFENINYPCLWVEFLITICITAYKFWTLYYVKKKNDPQEQKEPAPLPPPPAAPYEEKYLTKYRQTRDSAKREVCTDKLLLLMNSMVMEKTPAGNVMMRYNHQRESFEYFSDVSVPYRYLEVVCRKYVLMFDCLDLYIDMAEEIRRIERETQQLAAQNEAAAATMQEKESDEMLVPTKKKVYATFKGYNKEGGSGKVIMAPPPKNSIPNKQHINMNNNNNNTEIMKERINRFSHLGKIINFSFLQKVTREKVEARHALSYRSFKLQQCNK